jgi:4-aminobutyrate aminotransferase-like enzyme
MGRTYKHFFEKPLYLVRGEGVWLYDNEGRRYLDCYNNVPSVGHCHPHVVEVLSRQAATLNTHTRYLHHAVIEYAEMLGALLPGDLSVCTFVCTGTEANDLAYRMAQTVTGNDGAIVTSGAYHGNSTLVTELSPDNENLRSGKDFIVDVEPPYTYRGPYSGDHSDVESKYAALVDEAIDVLNQRGRSPAMMMIDNIYDAKAILTPGPAYLQQVYRKVRAAGGMIIADEVQSGLCRLGDHYWGFEDSEVIPDIVTMGKPIGAGHPVAAVVTTPEIADEFAKKAHYFNTFGGNPVSACVGKAVLEIVEQEQILDSVNKTGAHFKAGLEELASRFEIIGEVRGKGLFLGVELVDDGATRTPATNTASQIVELMRQSGVLIATTGEFDNVLKFRPPLVFKMKHADLVLERLEAALVQSK